MIRYLFIAFVIVVWPLAEIIKYIAQLFVDGSDSLIKWMEHTSVKIVRKQHGHRANTKTHSYGQ